MGLNLLTKRLCVVRVRVEPEVAALHRIKTTKRTRVSKDLTDLHTLDLIAPALHVTCGQVLMDRQRHIAIVAKRGRTSAHLVQVKSGMLKLTKLTARQLVDEWFDADYPFDQAVAKLLELGKQHGITEAARIALEGLAKSGREPVQENLFA